MEMLELANTDLKVSRLCAGCMGLGGGFQRGLTLTKEHEKEARSFLESALSLGINFFDHANIYAFGRAEEVFGRVMRENKGLRDRIVLQSKCGIRWADDPAGTPQRYDFSHRHIALSVEAILGRLGTDHLDILLLHRPDVLWEGEEIARAFAELKAAGKVRYFGVSNLNRAGMEYLQSFLPDPLVANQLQMSLQHHGFAEQGISFNQASPGYPDGMEGALEYCRLKGVSLQAWSPLARGVFTSGKLSAESEAVRKTAALVALYGSARDLPAEAIVLAWLLKHPARIVPVLGTTRPERLVACAKALEVSLSREEWYRLFETARGRPMP
jgi:predicted oxidoreductase